MSAFAFTTTVVSGIEVSSGDGGVSVRRIGFTRQVLVTTAMLVPIVGGSIAVIFQQSESWVLRTLCVLLFVPFLKTAIELFSRSIPSHIDQRGSVVRHWFFWRRRTDLGPNITVEVQDGPIQIVGYSLPQSSVVMMSPLGRVIIATGQQAEMELLRQEIAKRMATATA